MCSITELHDEFGSYLLKDGENSLCVMTKRGGLVQSFVCGGREIFYCDLATVEDWSREVRGGIPVLFPACGRLKEGPYGAVPKHGFARALPWRVSEKKCDGGVSLAVLLESNEETRKTYPHEFTLRHVHTLQGNTYTVCQTVTNTGENELPFSLGLHPYFNIDAETATAAVPSHRYEGLDGENTFDGKFAFQNAYDSVCKNLFGKEAILETGLGHRVRISWTEPYQYCVVWSPENVKFACVEPWTAPPNALNTGVDLLSLAPGESASCEMRISVE